MYDGAVGHDGVVFLQLEVALVVISGVWKAVDRAALRTGADRHAGNGLVAAHAAHCTCATRTVLRFLNVYTTAQSSFT